MDFRALSIPAPTLEHAKRLAVQGLLTYQPFIFDDTLETGVGLEFAVGHYCGLVHYPDIPQHWLASPELRRLILDPDRHLEFRAANERLRALYDHCVSTIIEAVGDVRNTSFLDVGCNTGYFPQSFARHGAALAAGCDRQDFSDVFALLNGILETDARFLNTSYDPRRHVIPDLEPFDVVTSFAVLCHTSDPLFHLACLGRLARKALLVWTLVNEDDRHTVHYGEPRGDYPDDAFPICFDNLVCPSDSLMMRSMDLMGFKNVIRLPDLDTPSFQYTWKGYPFRGYLGLR